MNSGRLDGVENQLSQGLHYAFGTHDRSDVMLPDSGPETDRAGGQHLTIAIIVGDGIGPELLAAARRVLDAATAEISPKLLYVEEDAGASTFERTGTSIADDTLQRLVGPTYAAILKGPTGLPAVRRPDGTEAGLLGGVLRSGLDTYANVRPIRLLHGAGSPLRSHAGAVDYVIVRENTEGLYLSRGKGVGTDNAVADQLLVTRHGVERVARFAFDLARTRNGAPADGVRRVTVVDKSNVLRTYAFFRQVTTEVAADYPDIELTFRYADAAAHDLILTPQYFDVLVMENFLGDILSDLGAATVGGLGMCGSANVGDHHAYFEPIHGSAPDLAGRDTANPISQIMSGAMMLDYLGLPAAAARVRRGVERSLAEGSVSFDHSGRPTCGTQAVADTVIAHLP